MSEADEGCGIDGSQINGPSRWVEKETSEREEIEDAPHNEVFLSDRGRESFYSLPSAFLRSFAD